MLASGSTQHDAEKAISMASSADASLHPEAHRAANGDIDGHEGTDGGGGGDQPAETNGASGKEGLQFNEQTHYMNVKRIILVSHGGQHSSVPRSNRLSPGVCSLFDSRPGRSDGPDHAGRGRGGDRFGSAGRCQRRLDLKRILFDLDKLPIALWACFGHR